jgi:hypothetical protein
MSFIHFTQHMDLLVITWGNRGSKTENDAMVSTSPLTRFDCSAISQFLISYFCVAVCRLPSHQRMGRVSVHLWTCHELALGWLRLASCAAPKYSGPNLSPPHVHKCPGPSHDLVSSLCLLRSYILPSSDSLHRHCSSKPSSLSAMPSPSVCFCRCSLLTYWRKKEHLLQDKSAIP